MFLRDIITANYLCTISSVLSALNLLKYTNIFNPLRLRAPFRNLLLQKGKTKKNKNVKKIQYYYHYNACQLVN